MTDDVIYESPIKVDAFVYNYSVQGQTLKLSFDLKSSSWQCADEDLEIIYDSSLTWLWRSLNQPNKTSEDTEGTCATYKSSFFNVGGGRKSKRQSVGNVSWRLCTTLSWTYTKREGELWTDQKKGDVALVYDERQAVSLSSHFLGL